MLSCRQANCQPARLVHCSGRRFQKPLIQPERLGFLEVDPVLGLIDEAFVRIVVEVWKYVKMV